MSRFAEGSVQEDEYNDMRREAAEAARHRRNLSCGDGYCGADDCPRCRPGCTAAVRVTCEWCADEFETLDEDDKFCSESCQKRAASGMELWEL